MKRMPSDPPDLQGYTPVRMLGSGGFADVFLYHEALPSRDVAIKVILQPVTDPQVRQQFRAEADVMASLGAHPAIVQIHRAGIASDSRPYLVMDYCSRPNYGVRFRRDRITVAEALQVGIKMAGAVETAHRAGILHRDLKPANILVDAYDRAMLTDFGIASTLEDLTGDPEQSTGLSVPWSAPELFGDAPRADRCSDVFSLCATVYSLLAGRTPFEKQQGRNSAPELIARIINDPLPPVGRPDCPDGLYRVLAAGMAKMPAERYQSAQDVGRALQQVEQALGYGQTPMDLPREDTALPEDDLDDDDERTRIRAITTIDPARAEMINASRPRRDGAPAGPHSAPEAPPAAPPQWASSAYSAVAAPSSRKDDDGTTEHTVLRRVESAVPPNPGQTSASEELDRLDREDAHASQPRRRRRWPVVAGLCAVVLAIGIGSVLAVRSVTNPGTAATTSSSSSGPIVVATPPQKLTDVSADVIIEQQGQDMAKVKITWKQPPDFSEGDTYQWEWDGLPSDYDDTEVSDTKTAYESSLVTDVPLGLDPVCVKVRHVSVDNSRSDWSQACVESG